MSSLIKYLERIFTDRPVTRARRLFVLAFVIVTLISLLLWLVNPLPLIPTGLQEFLKNITIEAWGLVFDILVIVLFLTWLSERAARRHEQQHQEDQRNQTIQRYIEEIDDYRGWDEKEAKHRIVGLIRRLNKMGITEIDLHGVFLQNADLTGTDLTKANLEKANLAGADLRTANLTSANLTEANLTGANLANANLTDANLTDANLTNANLAMTLLPHAKLFFADLQQACLFSANLTDAALNGADLRRANLQGARLGSANLTKADLRDAALGGKANPYPSSPLSNEFDLLMGARGANLHNANLHGADLRGADLRNANLRDTQLWKTDLRSTKLNDTNLKDPNQLHFSSYNNATQWPDNLTPPASATNVDEPHKLLKRLLSDQRGR
jgi:uncharacterized protein YjbI with pentapeptide repeats